ncbi:MAG TPA: hypothetical protein VFY03_00435 [Woeseiaceae bacterium]|nr:hypothetical protein [Woeseiaceae bacterium]
MKAANRASTGRAARAVAGVSALFAAAAGNAQAVAPPVPDYAVDYQQMVAEYETTQATAVRPGDENLGCDALENELTAIVNDPAFRSYIETAGAAAERDMALVQNAQAAMVSGVSPAALPSMPRVSAADRVQEQARQAETLSALMPKIFRAQRVNELAVLQACDWLGEGTMPGVNEGTMPGMNEGTMPGINESTMPGMTHPGAENPAAPAD